jgi:hypothetical protein
LADASFFAPRHGARLAWFWSLQGVIDSGRWFVGTALRNPGQAYYVCTLSRTNATTSRITGAGDGRRRVAQPIAGPFQRHYQGSAGGSNGASRLALKPRKWCFYGLLSLKVEGRREPRESTHLTGGGNPNKPSFAGRRHASHPRRSLPQGRRFDAATTPYMRAHAAAVRHRYPGEPGS